MTYDLTNYLDPKFDTVPEAAEDFFKPKWFVVEIVANDSRDIVAVFDAGHEKEAIQFVAASSRNLKIIPAS